MATDIAEKIKKTQNSFPPQKPGAVAECPVKTEVSEAVSMPVETKINYHLTQQMTKPVEAMRGEAPEKQKEKKDWIEIILVDMEGKPVPNVRYRITPPGGAPVEGRLNEHGQAGLYQIEAGSCKITFPDLDKEAWE
jgi:hypothetical protein